MSDTAVHLEQEVLPEVPVRHWVCTFPWGVRAVLGYDRELCREAVSAFARELSRSLKRRAKRELGLSSVDDALTGLVVVVQRTDGALRLNCHLHVLGLDGVYVEDEQGELGFHILGTPPSAEVRDIARGTALRLHRAFQKKGRQSPWDDEHAFVDSGEADPFSLEEPGLYACYQAAASGVAVSAERAGQPVLRLLVQSPKEPEGRGEAVRADQPCPFGGEPSAAPQFNTTYALDYAAVGITSDNTLLWGLSMWADPWDVQENLEKPDDSPGSGYWPYAIPDTNTFYAIAAPSVPGDQAAPFVLKYDTSGELLWGRPLSDFPNAGDLDFDQSNVNFIIYFIGADVDTEGNLYMVLARDYLPDQVHVVRITPDGEDSLTTVVLASPVGAPTPVERFQPLLDSPPRQVHVSRNGKSLSIGARASNANPDGSRAPSGRWMFTKIDLDGGASWARVVAPDGDPAGSWTMMRPHDDGSVCGIAGAHVITSPNMATLACLAADGELQGVGVMAAPEDVTEDSELAGALLDHADTTPDGGVAVGVLGVGPARSAEENEHIWLYDVASPGG